MDWHPHRIDPVFHLLDHVLLITPAIGQPNNLGRLVRPIGDVKEIPHFFKEFLFCALHTDVLAQDHHPVGIPTFARPIFHFRHVLAHQFVILKFLLYHDLFLVADPFGPRFSQDLILGQSFQPLPGAGRKPLGQGHQLRMGIEAQNKPRPLLVPPVQLRGVRKVGVATHRDPARDLAHQPNGPINPGHALTVAGDVARPVHQVQHFACVGQAHDQRRITPNPFVG